MRRVSNRSNCTYGTCSICRDLPSSHTAASRLLAVLKLAMQCLPLSKNALSPLFRLVIPPGLSLNRGEHVVPPSRRRWCEKNRLRASPTVRGVRWRRAARPRRQGRSSKMIGASGRRSSGRSTSKPDPMPVVRMLTYRRTERTYVRGLGELVAIYVKPASQLVNPGKAQTETVVPAAERKIVFGGIESILTIHRDNLLPALERVIRHLLEGQDDEEGALSSKTAHDVGDVFRTYIAYMKQYSAYINNFDNALSRMKTWTAPISSPVMLAFPTKPTSPNITIASAAVSVGMGMSTVSMPINECAPQSGSSMTTSQRKRVKAFLKVSHGEGVLVVSLTWRQRCREHPMHSQINLESYLLLPIQRVPRYKLLVSARSNRP